MIRMTCTPLTGVIKKKKHDQSIRSFLVHFGFCLCLSIQLAHVITLFFSSFCHKVLFFVVRWSQTILRLSKTRKKKNHVDTLRGNYEHVLFHWFRLEEPRAIVLFNHIRIELLNRDLIICSNFDLTEKKFGNSFCEDRKTERRKRSFRNASSPEKNCLYGIHQGGHSLFEMSFTYQEDPLAFG